MAIPHRLYILRAVFLVCGVACGEQTSTAEGLSQDPASADTAAETASATSDPRLYRLSRPLMGTVFEITVVGVPEPEARPAVQRALDEIGRLEDVLSEWRDTSEISRINAQAGVAPVPVGEDTLAVVRAGLQVAAWSEGAFDMSWAALRGMYRFQRGDHRIPPRGQLREALRRVNWKDVVVNEQARTVFLRRKGMAIGTGGIAKGYALDRAAEILVNSGIDHFMLFGGGQVQVRGTRGSRPWRVGIQHPRRAEYFAFLEATGGSLSTSGDYERFFIDDEGTRWHHILDPSTGMPARKAMSVTYVAPRGIYSDALSTACFVLGQEKCFAMLSREEMQDHAAVIVDHTARVHPSDNVKSRLHFRAPLVDGKLP